MKAKWPLNGNSFRHFHEKNIWKSFSINRSAAHSAWNSMHKQQICSPAFSKWQLSSVNNEQVILHPFTRTVYIECSNFSTVKLRVWARAVSTKVPKIEVCKLDFLGLLLGWTNCSDWGENRMSSSGREKRMDTLKFEVLSAVWLTLFGQNKNQYLVNSL